ncbi:DUF4291 domain-containing protein [Luteolibacter sp. GHJ8]|uniref:DUF4291 domain-containing protein n=1 Tax=Luteolibacter rhizosphaerae TaxID=2989719 RepID=A0ABT3G0X5_9BACT|nr:DUF4291 domain-containing protein [Luteolibacter rhizosphaerae]MCW1913495.1 DUF4291 domain-containing protein [Luteolibacter rhizosphaerae]
MKLADYNEVVTTWPAEGRHILASHDEDSVVVYQAYRPAIGRYAAENQRLGGDFSFSRMSWIKPNFLWMMYRSGWGTKEGQEITLAVTIPRSFFDEMLAAAVVSSFDSTRYRDTDQWKADLERSEVRLQWDPDHAPDGTSQKRRAIQLGLRGEMLRRYAERELIRIEDISDFVAAQRTRVSAGNHGLSIPFETVYRPGREDAAANVGLDLFDYGCPPVSLTIPI